MLSFYLSTLETEEERAKMNEIYAVHKSVMLRYALSITKNRETAEDAVHNAFLSVIKHKKELFKLSCRDFRVRIVIITKNKCIDLLRQQNKLSGDQLEDLADSLEASDMPVEQQIIQSEEYESIRKHVAALDETSRLVLEMKYLLGMSYKEIGKELGMTPKHVDTKLMRAKEKVRKLVIKGGEPVER